MYIGFYIYIFIYKFIYMFFERSDDRRDGRRCEIDKYGQAIGKVECLPCMIDETKPRYDYDSINENHLKMCILF